ncbi:MAG: hypothetical protein CVV64_15290 [Candidatus Wallbacteria bacterium HGW-Wallbacteria-1]|uniref:Uncharacterized protein n=1 Tax=Candidatus Wallbacteria bacterium HGW-Wallbacteria-1 TaxID=2013854 RepID=A0A2N1PLL8_9BACT|nr:MAG: hypothetical protein CVV64_15290 [Candidatus Wallbacteria bacterium HGW-Wallbacteria-1]
MKKNNVLKLFYLTSILLISLYFILIGILKINNTRKANEVNQHFVSLTKNSTEFKDAIDSLIIYSLCLNIQYINENLFDYYFDQKARVLIFFHWNIMESIGMKYSKIQNQIVTVPNKEYWRKILEKENLKTNIDQLIEIFENSSTNRMPFDMDQTKMLFADQVKIVSFEEYSKSDFAQFRTFHNAGKVYSFSNIGFSQDRKLAALYLIDLCHPSHPKSAVLIFQKTDPGWDFHEKIWIE